MTKKPTKQDVKLATQYINELQDADIKKRISAAQNLAFIAKTLGNDRVIRELIPFLRQQILNDETQVVMQVLDEVYKIAKVLGGGMNATHLFPLVEDLLESQEQKIRRKAINEYSQLVQICEIKKCQNQIVSSLKRIWTLEFIEARQAFVMVIAKQLGSFCPPNQNDFLSTYQQMAESESVMLRKFAAIYSSDLVNWIKCNEPVILKIVQMLFKDKEESNKIYLVDTIIELAKIKPPTSLQPYFNLISYQFSWRVRYQLIAKIGLLAQAMGKQSFKSFLSYIIKYINDIEPEIRSISCLKLQQLTKYVDVDDIVNRIIPALKNLTQDQQVYVKHSLASSILHLCKVIGKKNTTDLILPKFLALLKDDDQQVRLTIFKNVGLICDVLGVETLSQTTMPALYELATHTNWRIRAQSIVLLFYFISRSPKQFMDDKNTKLAIDYIRDRAFAVRKAGMKLLANIARHHQALWFEKNIMPKLINIFKATSYLQRSTILLTMQELMPALSVQYVEKYIYPGIKDLASDEVENVRLTSIQTLKDVIDILPKQKENIKKIIRKLSTQDSDKDVREKAEKVLKQIQ